MQIKPETKARIVIADDDAENLSTVEACLKAEGYSTKICPDGEAALQLAKSWNPHLMILDINMPKLTGLEALKKVRELGKDDYIGVILLTANADLGNVVQGLDTGADDYIVKPYRLEELRARVRANLRVKALHDALRRANRRLEEAATYDELTGLRNMRFAMKKLETEITQLMATPTTISCLMMDMDHFKQVNDTHDHLFGSHVLREVGQLVHAALRPADTGARYGGDEFFICLPGLNMKEAEAVAERLRKSIEAHHFSMGTHSTRVTASFGVATLTGPVTGSTPDELAREIIRRADGALYSAKNLGRNRIETDNMAAPFRRKL